MPTRKEAITRVKLFDVGQGDPIVTDHGLGWYDSLEKSNEFVTPTYRSDGFPHLEYLDLIGMTCRPRVVKKDTLASSYTLSGGGWESVAPMYGSPRWKRLVQVDSSSGVLYSATSKFELPANPHVALSMLMAETPADWDSEEQPPFARVEFGVTMALQLDKNGLFLLEGSPSGWQMSKEMSRPSNGEGYTDIDEMWFYIRPMGEKLCISVDHGKHYDAFLDFGIIPSGPIIFRGQGGNAAFGLHQIQYETGSYWSMRHDAGGSRVGPVPVITGRYETPNGSAVAFLDASSPLDSVAQYKATLTPGTQVIQPFTFYTPPVLGAVQFEYPTVIQTTGNAGSNPWDPWLLSASVELADDISESSCVLRFHHDAHTAFVGEFRWRKVEVTQGYKLSDDTEELYTTFVGYIGAVDLNREEFGSVGVQVTVENTSISLRRQEWSPFDIVTLGGMTVNAAADYVLLKAGRNFSYRNWHADGNLILLPAGTPEEPFEMLKPRETYWETLVRIFGYANLELGVADDGTFFTVPEGYVSPTVDYHYYPTPEALVLLQQQIANINNSFDAGPSGTAVIVTGKLEDGTEGMFYAVDSDAESNIASGRFSPWRELIQEEVSGISTPGLLIGRAQALAAKHFALRFELQVSVPIDFTVVRRMRVAIHGCTSIGIGEGEEYGVFPVSHSSNTGETLATMRTEMGLRRL